MKILKIWYKNNLPKTAEITGCIFTKSKYTEENRFLYIYSGLIF